jgi:hypothetical protein
LGIGLSAYNSPQLEYVGDAFPTTKMVLSLDTRITTLLKNVASTAEDIQMAPKSVNPSKY